MKIILVYIPSPSHLCLSLAQGFFADWGNWNVSAKIFRVSAVWNLLDCVGAFHPVVSSCEATYSALGPSHHSGKRLLSIFAIVMGWGCPTDM